VECCASRLRMGTKILIDNASLDRILLWPERAQEELRRSLSGQRFTVYFAPETIAEMLAIGATRNASRLPELASLVTALLNGRIFQDYFSVLKHEVKGDRTSPFLGEGDKRAILKRLSSLATHGIPDDREWFLHGESLIRKEKERDSQWRKGFQELYRGRPQEMKKSGAGRVTLDEFRAHPSVKDLVSSRVEAICIEVGIPDPAQRASGGTLSPLRRDGGQAKMNSMMPCSSTWPILIGSSRRTAASSRSSASHIRRSRF